jgi:hypothetical protein
MSERSQMMSAAPLPRPNAEQEKAILETVAVFGSSPDVELLSWEVIDPDEFLADGEEPEGIYVEFRYHDPRERIDPLVIFPGRQVAVFAADGAVMTSQDFG